MPPLTTFLLLLISPLLPLLTSAGPPSRPPLCIADASIPTEHIPPPRPADCRLLASTLRALPSASRTQAFIRSAQYLRREGTCQLWIDVADEDRASYEEVAEVVAEVVGGCLLMPKSHTIYVGGITRLGRENDLTVWVTGIWDPSRIPGPVRLAAGGGVGRVDVT